jgi:Rad3-related DNA helicase
MDGDGDHNVQWVRDYNSYHAKNGGVTWKAVRVSGFGGERVWGWCEDALAMSATVVSSDEWADSCGVDAAGVGWGEVTVPSPFPVANRPVVFAPVANMTAKTTEEELPKLLRAVERILETDLDNGGGGSRVLIHTTSYRINTAVVEHLRRTVKGREIVTHDQGGGVRDRDHALRRYLATESSVLCSPAMDRGVDLPGEACRVQIVCKVPFPNLGDRQIATRLRTPGGQSWYTVNTARTIVQMTGRGVRSVDDYATTYVLDKQFGRWWKEAKNVLPEWWTASVKPGQLRDFQ